MTNAANSLPLGRCPCVACCGTGRFSMYNAQVDLKCQICDGSGNQSNDHAQAIVTGIIEFHKQGKAAKWISGYYSIPVERVQLFTNAADLEKAKAQQDDKLAASLNLPDESYLPVIQEMSLHNLKATGKTMKLVCRTSATTYKKGQIVNQDDFGKAPGKSYPIDKFRGEIFVSTVKAIQYNGKAAIQQHLEIALEYAPGYEGKSVKKSAPVPVLLPPSLDLTDVLDLLLDGAVSSTKSKPAKPAAPPASLPPALPHKVARKFFFEEE